jgi:hypothetical protein
MRSFADEVYISAVSCNFLTRSSNAVARSRRGGMSFPQLGFPRFRGAGSAAVIVIRLVQQEILKASVLSCSVISFIGHFLKYPQDMKSVIEGAVFLL